MQEVSVSLYNLKFTLNTFLMVCGVAKGSHVKPAMKPPPNSKKSPVEDSSDEIRFDLSGKIKLICIVLFSVIIVCDFVMQDGG